MSSHVRRATDRLQNVLQFCENPPPPLDNPATLGPNFVPQRDALRDAVARLTDYHTDAASGRPNGATHTRRALRQALRQEHLDPIRRIAIALEKSHPELPRTLRVPGVHLGDARQLSTARAIARDVAPYHDLFVADGLPVDFIDTLNAAIASLAQSVDGRQADQQRRAALNAGVRLAVEDGNQAVRHLDPLVRLAIRAANDDVHGAPALAAWERACRSVRATVPAAAPPDAPTASQAQVQSAGEHTPVATPAVAGTPAPGFGAIAAPSLSQAA